MSHSSLINTQTTPLQAPQGMADRERRAGTRWLRGWMTLAIAICSVVLVRSSAADESWLTDLEAAKTQAAAEGKSILVDFTGSDWCVWCIRLDQEVFATEEFAAAGPQKFVLVKLDFPRDKSAQSAEEQAANEKWSTEYAVSAFPTILLLDEQGRPFAQTGYQEGGPAPYLTHLDELLQVRAKRDAAFAKADAATGVDRAKLLDEAIADLDSSLATKFYAEVVKEIGELDAEDVAGLRTKYFAAQDRERQEALMARVELASKTLPVDQALETVDQVLAEQRLPAAVRREILGYKLKVLDRAERDEDQLQVLDEMLGIEGLDPEVYERDFVVKAYALVACGRQEDAIEMLGSRIAATLKNRSLYLTRAELLARTGHFEKALADFAVVKEAAGREPDLLVEVAMSEADCLLELEREDEALAVIDAVLKRQDIAEDLRADTLIEKAMILRELGSVDAAVEAEDQALSVTTDPRRRAALVKLIESLRDELP